MEDSRCTVYWKSLVVSGERFLFVWFILCFYFSREKLEWLTPLLLFLFFNLFNKPRPLPISNRTILASLVHVQWAASRLVMRNSAYIPVGPKSWSWLSSFKILLVVANLVSRTGKYESVKEGYYHLQQEPIAWKVFLRSTFLGKSSQSSKCQ